MCPKIFPINFKTALKEVRPEQDQGVPFWDFILGFLEGRSRSKGVEARNLVTLGLEVGKMHVELGGWEKGVPCWQRTCDGFFQYICYFHLHQQILLKIL